MTSPAKVEANRLNAQKSTGPRTARGKALARFNAVRHGVLTVSPLIPGEDVALWDQRRQGVLDALAPSGALELALAERVALTLWRLDRLTRAEALAASADLDRAILPEPPSASEEYREKMRRAALPDRDPRETEASFLGFAREAQATAALVEDLPRIDPDTPCPKGDVGKLFRAVADAVTGEQLEALPETDSAGCRSSCGVVEGTDWTAATVLVGLAKLAEAAHLDPAGLRAATAKSERREAKGFLAHRGKSRTKRLGVAERERTELARQAAGALIPARERAELLIRYEAHLNKILGATLRDYDRLQAARSGGGLKGA